MEPWLDSLSEDWNSEPRLSSPASSLANRSKTGAQASLQSQSKIPHLAQSIRRDSLTSSFLKPRSSRGIARANGRVLSERSQSSLNLPPSSPHDNSQKRQSSTLPRRASSAFSESQSSVQRHTVTSTSNLDDTPEWKRRLAKGEDIASDGFDLFSPSKLEGIFTEPTSGKKDPVRDSTASETDVKPWSALKLPQVITSNEPYNSYRTSRSRAAVMEALQEVNEDEEEEDHWQKDRQQYGNRESHDMSAVSSDLVRDGSMRGLVKRRISNLEHLPHSASPPHQEKATSDASRDPRWRTCSGQEEMRNEFISPVTVSAKNTIREKALKTSVELDREFVNKRLASSGLEDRKRPSSRSSDRDVSYMGNGLQSESLLHEEPLAEITSVSLPEDLSMGTQDLHSSWNYGAPKRTRSSNVSLLMRRKVSSHADISQLEDAEQHSIAGFRSSPPPYNKTEDELLGRSRFTASLAGSSIKSSVVKHSPSPTRQSSKGSPLKLFGNRDTYTSNKLMRVLSQYEQDHSSVLEEGSEPDPDHPQQEAGLRMSLFGKGELDSFHFEKEIERPQTAPVSATSGGRSIFSDLAKSKLDEQNLVSKRSSNRARQNDVAYEEKLKRITSSPAKDRTPKRRRTLMKDEIFVDGVGVEIKVEQIPDMSSMAGRKRKDARPGENGAQANPEILANRDILQPRAGSRRSSTAGNARSVSGSSAQTAIGPASQLASALAAELETFAKGASEASQDSRKPSLATKDYMEEANKVMELIRARGKPRTNLPGIQEPDELDPDSILDMDLEDDSTKESFSRPPSRERTSRPWEDRRIAKHDPQTASQLKKYQEPDDLDLLASTSAIGTFKLVDNHAADEAALVPVPGDEQESSPPNIRILNVSESVSDRRQSISTTTLQTSSSLPGSTRRTFASGSSHSSAQKGVISSGVVSIPEKIGTMTFDREKQIWIKQQLALKQAAAAAAEIKHAPQLNEVTLEDDPFEDIPDLSVDEQHEAAMRVVPKPASRPSSAGTVNHQEDNYESDGEESISSTLPESDRPEPQIVEEDGEDMPHEDEYRQTPTVRSTASEASKHEMRLHDGFPSVMPSVSVPSSKQARVVTIAFSSPVASAIPCTETEQLSPEDDFDDDDFLPPEDSDYEDYIPTPKVPSSHGGQTNLIVPAGNNASGDGEPDRRFTQKWQAMSPIKEDNDDHVAGEGNSLVHIKNPRHWTPQAANDHTNLPPTLTYKGASILCLTPLSEFTMHQADRAKHPEESFVAARPHPKALLQAHGALVLSRDEMVKAITDATPNEPFWERLRCLDLTAKRLTSLEELQEYCPALQELRLADNEVTQLNGLPVTLRELDISGNQLNDFSSWSHLSNLQYVDVSGNQLESLNGFSSLCHMRNLTARSNQIRDIDGVLDLRGLICLDLSHNQLSEVDFEAVDLPYLEELNLSSNRLTTIRNLQCSPRLKKLVLSDNSIKEFRVSHKMPWLKEIHMAHNELESIELDFFPSLEVLMLDDNCIRSIGALEASVTLRDLSLREQRHSQDIVNEILQTPNECEVIRLSSNTVAHGRISLPVYPQYNLRHLELACCGLKGLPLNFGEYFPNCRTLNLNYNAVQDLSPILGCMKLHQLMLAENRIKRLRRTCLVLGKLPQLRKLDMRDNPLTVGFYPPKDRSPHGSEPYALPQRSSKYEIQWLERLDETTSLRRRTVELLLAEKSSSLQELDGAQFNLEDVTRSDMAWRNLVAKGVLVKAIEAAEPVGQTTVMTLAQVNQVFTADGNSIREGTPHD